MDFRRPFGVVTPTLDGDVLSALAGASDSFTGREVHRLVGHGSEEGVRKALDRLVRQGIVLSRRAGSSKLYELNRDHLAAPAVAQLASLREQLIERLRTGLRGWRIQPEIVALFGSASRWDAGPASDLDLFVVRPDKVDEEDPTWREQVDGLASEATRWTGNDMRVVEYSRDELRGTRRGEDELIDDIVEQSIAIVGDLRATRRSMAR